MPPGHSPARSLLVGLAPLLPARFLPIGLILLGLAACGGTEGDQARDLWEGTDRVEDSIRTVRTLSGSVWGGEGRLVEEWTIGRETRGEHDLLGEVYGIAVSRDRVLVLDRS